MVKALLAATRFVEAITHLEILAEVECRPLALWMGLGECYPFKSDLVMARLANQALKSYRTQVEGRQRGDLMGTLRKRIVVLAWTIKLRSQRREQKICKDTVILVQFCKEGDDRRYDQRHSPGRSDFSKLGPGSTLFLWSGENGHQAPRCGIVLWTANITPRPFRSAPKWTVLLSLH